MRRIPGLGPNAWSQGVHARRSHGAPLLDLTEGNPTLAGLSELSGEERAAIARGAAEPYRPEPMGLMSAREAVAAHYGERGIRVSPDDVVLTSGTSESYAHVLRVLTEPGDVVLIPAPSYPLVEPIAALEGVGARTYRLEFHGRWALDVASVEAAIADAGGRARAIVVVEPNHPTGTRLDATEREFLWRLSALHGLSIVSDEVFGDSGWPPGAERQPSWLEELATPTFVLGGLSKARGLPQLKLGWIVLGGPGGSRAHYLVGLEWIADLFLSVASPVQHALPALLAGCGDFQRRVRSRLAANLGALRALEARRSEVTLLEANAGWSAILRLPSTRTGEEWALALLERDVVVYPGHFFDIEGEAYLVVSLIVVPEAFREGISRLEALLADAPR